MSEKIPKILVVDDDAANRLTLKHVLLHAGYEPVLASTGEDGIAIAFKGQIDLILLDIMMPDLDGFAVLTRLQADSQAKNIPVVFVSALIDDQDIIRGLQLGAKDYFTKPIHPDLLRLRIRNILDASLANRRLHQIISDLNKEIILRTEVEINLRASRIELQQFALLDALTQIPNRRHLDESLKRSYAEMHRKQEYLSFLMCDIDYFKCYNDLYGHVAGDECLTQVARCLVQSTNRPSDVVARFGGEEFALLLPDTGLGGALHVARNIQKNLASLAIPHGATKIVGQQLLTLSIGVYCLIPEEKDQILEVMNKADLALYHAKNKGRNAIAVCDDHNFCRLES